MSDELKLGDVVKLKSSGPSMTVDAINPETGGVLCVWFEKGVQKSHVFAPHTLAQATLAGTVTVGNLRSR